MKQPALLIVLIAVAFLALSIRILKSQTGFHLVVNLVTHPDEHFVKPDDVFKMDDPLILDTRTIDEYAVSHLQNATWMGFENFSAGMIGDTPMDKTILVYCTVGSRSKNVMNILQQAGYKNAYNLYGGIINWKNSGFKIVDADELPTDAIHPYNKFWAFWVKK